MVVRRGFVKEKKGSLLRVCFERPDACEGCKGCAKGLVPQRELLTVFGQAEVGDQVDVRMPEARTLKATLMAYAVPLLAMLAGLAVGFMLNCGDLVSLLLALGGLAAGYLAVRAFEMRLRRDPLGRPTVISVVQSRDTEHEKE
ncbi:MAG: SoxR reducing system RseC family protein [Clostridia bacterium]|nr:SoxR reducing system RseC family protein [Clostridia bacterium]